MLHRRLSAVGRKGVKPRERISEAFSRTARRQPGRQPSAGGFEGSFRRGDAPFAADTEGPPGRRRGVVGRSVERVAWRPRGHRNSTDQRKPGATRVPPQRPSLWVSQPSFCVCEAAKTQHSNLLVISRQVFDDEKEK